MCWHLYYANILPNNECSVPFYYSKMGPNWQCFSNQGFMLAAIIHSLRLTIA